MEIIWMLLLLSSFYVLFVSISGHKVGWTGSQGQCENEALDWYSELMGYTQWNAGGANLDGRFNLANLTSTFGVLPHYLNAGKVFASRNNPLAATFLPYARSFSLFDQMTSLPTDGNEPEDINFELPPADTIAFDGMKDLLYMPIKQMASLIESRRVTCVDVVEFFINATKRIDPHLAIVTVPLYDEAMTAASALDKEIESTGKTRGPLTCIPFGLKDHHMVYNETTTIGHILNYNNKHTLKSSLVHRLMSYGAIPIAKTALGAFASGAVHGWGVCLSPYLNGQGCGSSCGSGSGAAAGVFPFALSEETSGSIACPSAFSFISGYLSSYGVLSRGGADLLAMEFDHLGWHSRYVSDYGILLNYARTGVDPLDGDTVSFKFEDPAKIDPSTLKVLMIGKGASSSYGSTGHKWESERLGLIQDALVAAGVDVTIASALEAKAMWSWDESDELFDAFRLGSVFRIFSYANVWGEQSRDQLSARNSRSYQKFTIGSANLPAIGVNYIKAVIIHFGRLFLGDPVWKKYDAIVDINSKSAGNYPANDSNFENMVRTAKVFVADHYERSNLIEGRPGAIEGTTVSVTTLPWQEATAFRVAEIIQEHPPIKAKMMFPDFERIEQELSGRSRCAGEFFSKLDARTAMLVNETDGLPLAEAAFRYKFPDGCPLPNQTALRESQFLPTKWAESLYIAPYELDAKGLSAMPLKAIFDIERYSEEEICELKPSFCAYNDARGFPNSVPGAPLVEADPRNTSKCTQSAIVVNEGGNDNANIMSQGILIGIPIGILIGFLIRLLLKYVVVPHLIDLHRRHREGITMKETLLTET